MADVYLRASNASAVTCISNIFIDEYMKDANGEYVKIYLYLLRCLSREDIDFSISAIAEKLDHTEKDVRRALAYWEKTHLLQLEYDEAGEIKGICILNPHITPGFSASAAPETFGRLSAAVPDTSRNLPAVIPETRKTYSPEDESALCESEDIKELLFISARYLGRPLSKTETDAILYWYDGMGFSADLIEYLVEYCVGRGHKSIYYMEKVAQGWADAHITTVEEAKKSASIHSQTYYGVMKAFGISGRNLAESETRFIEKWTEDYGFTLDIINEACRRTIRNIQQPKFEYADSILTNWHQKQIHHLEDIALLDQAHAASAEKRPGDAPGNRFHNFSQRNYDYDILEKQLLQQ